MIDSGCFKSSAPGQFELRDDASDPTGQVSLPEPLQTWDCGQCGETNKVIILSVEIRFQVSAAIDDELDTLQYSVLHGRRAADSK